MVNFESEATIEAFVKRQATNPMARKHVDGRIVYRCHNDFGPVYEGRLGSLIPQITDFGSAQRGDRAAKFLYPIQPNEYRAPEVILGIGWTYSTDMWNFGVLVSLPRVGLQAMGHSNIILADLGAVDRAISLPTTKSAAIFARPAPG